MEKLTQLIDSWRPGIIAFTEELIATAGLSFWLEGGPLVPDTIAAPRIRGHVEGSLAAELSYFLACVIDGEKPQVVTAEEARQGIRVAAALVESATNDQEVVLD